MLSQPEVARGQGQGCWFALGERPIRMPAVLQAVRFDIAASPAALTPKFRLSGGDR